MDRLSAFKKYVGGIVDTSKIALFAPFFTEDHDSLQEIKPKASQKYCFYGRYTPDRNLVVNLDTGIVYVVQDDKIIVDNQTYENVSLKCTEDVNGKSQITTENCHLSNLLFSLKQIPCKKNNKYWKTVNAINNKEEIPMFHITLLLNFINKAAHQHVVRKAKSNEEKQQDFEM